MPKINNAQVIQKLVDDLKLYPGKDIIPTELAEKILPTYSLNENDEVTAVNKIANVIENIFKSSASTETIYTVPATGKFFLTNAAVSMYTKTANSAVFAKLRVTPKDGSASILLYLGVGCGATADYRGNNESLDLQNPIELDPASVISLELTDTGAFTSASIVGYTE